MATNQGGVGLETIGPAAGGSPDIITPAGGPAAQRRGRARQSVNPVPPVLTGTDQPTDDPADLLDAAPDGTPDGAITRTGEEVEILAAHGIKHHRRVDMPNSPTGKARAKIILRSYLVKGSYTEYVVKHGKTMAIRRTIERRIDGVPGQSMAIREFLLLKSVREIGESVDFQNVAIPIPGTEVDAGEVGYRSVSRQEAVAV